MEEKEMLEIVDDEEALENEELSNGKGEDDDE